MVILPVHLSMEGSTATMAITGMKGTTGTTTEKITGTTIGIQADTTIMERTGTTVLMATIR